jgi:3-hydroxybutyryl-CoA dehydrogenase
VGVQAMATALAPSTTVAVVGAGTMGAGIAQVAALAGHRVQLHDARFGAADAAKLSIGDALRKSVAKGRLAAAGAEAALARIHTVVTLADAAVAALVVEAIVEDVAAKRALIEQLENIVEPGCILASNTSSLSITALAAAARHPGRIVGMHFFNPAPLMPLVEVVRGLTTDPDVADAVFATAAAWGKTPVHAISTPGFIVNRCARPFYSEALRLLTERAASPATIDAVMRDAGGFRMGPFELMDLIGLDVNLAVTRGVWEACFGDPRYAPSLQQQERVAAGRLGRKTGRGLYEYRAGKPVKRPAGAIPAGLADRLIAPLVAEAKAALSEGIVGDADLVDAGAIFGTGFAPFTGGPLHYAAAR